MSRPVKAPSNTARRSPKHSRGDADLAGPGHHLVKGRQPFQTRDRRIARSTPALNHAVKRERDGGLEIGGGI